MSPKAAAMRDAQATAPDVQAIHSRHLSSVRLMGGDRRLGTGAQPTPSDTAQGA